MCKRLGVVIMGDFRIIAPSMLNERIPDKQKAADAVEQGGIIWVADTHVQLSCFGCGNLDTLRLQVPLGHEKFLTHCPKCKRAIWIEVQIGLNIVSEKFCLDEGENVKLQNNIQKWIEKGKPES